VTTCAENRVIWHVIGLFSECMSEERVYLRLHRAELSVQCSYLLLCIGNLVVTNIEISYCGCAVMLCRQLTSSRWSFAFACPCAEFLGKKLNFLTKIGR